MKRNQSKKRQRRRLNGRRPHERRGVLLLVVLSMLVLFLLVGTTFLLTSGQYRTASKIVEQKNRTTFQPADLLERALMQLVRDTNNTTSVVRYHSLLRDLYGVDGFVARVYTATPTITDPNDGTTVYQVLPRFAGVDQTVNPTAAADRGLGTTNGQVLDLFVLDTEVRSQGNQATLADGNAVGLDFDENGLPIEHELSSVDGFYAGCLLTMLDGPFRGQSVRVLDYDVAYRVQDTQGTPEVSDDTITVLARLRVLSPSRYDGRQLQPVAATGGFGLAEFADSAALGHRFIVNGRPFNGAGVGYNPLALSSNRTDAPRAQLSALEAMDMTGGGVWYGMEHALSPNAIHYLEAANVSLNPARGADPWSAPTNPDGSPRLGPGGWYPGDAIVPLTRRFVASTSSEYDPFTSPLYQTYAGPGDTDESYDAPDTQNMALASQALEPRSRGRVVNAAGQSLDPDAYYSGAGVPAPAYLDLEGVTIPSFHRPALANFWFHRLFRSQWLRDIVPTDSERVRAILEPFDNAGNAQHGLSANQAIQIAFIKRKFLLRPLREDHPDFDGSNPLSRYSSTRLRAALNGGNLVNAKGAGTDDDEITFPFWEAVGPWDVDNDGDGVNDSVWVDIGLPVQQTEDGRWYKPLVAMLVEDLDGRLNLNAHGSESDLVGQPLDVSDDTANFLKTNLAQDSTRLAGALTNATPVPVSGLLVDDVADAFNSVSWLRSSDQLPSGSGWGAAETSLRPVLSPTLPLNDILRNSGAFLGNAQYDDYARVLRGRPAPGDAGRSTAPPLNGSVAFGRYGSQRGFEESKFPQLTPQPGRTYLFDPNDPFETDANNLASGRLSYVAVRDARTPLEFLGYPAYTGAVINNQPEALSGFSSPLDLGGRYAGGLSGVGAAIDEAAYESSEASGYPTGSTWRELAQSAPDDSPYELDLSVVARKLPPADVTSVVASYDSDGSDEIEPFTAPLVDDAPFSAAELERILRAFDADSDELPNRLWEVVDAFDPTKLAAQTLVNSAIQTGGNPDTPLRNPNTLENAVASARAAINRRLVTTDSFDLPVPNENWADRLALGADGRPGVPRFETIGDWVATPFNNGIDDDEDGDVDELLEFPSNDDGDFGIGEPGVDDNGFGGIDEASEVQVIDEGDEAVVGYNPAEVHTFSTPSGPVQRSYKELFDAGCDDYVVVMRADPPQPGRLIDYLKYRVTLELARKGDIALYPATPLTPAQVADLRTQIDVLTTNILFGNDLVATDPARVTDLSSFGGLLAPEVLAGRRMDLNRPFGDGRDNNGNGVVDEPQEAGEPFVDRNGDGQIVGAGLEYLDLDGDGRWYGDRDGDGVFYVDNDGDGSFDGFDVQDMDSNNDGIVDSLAVDHLWFDANGDGIENTNEVRPFDHVGGVDADGSGLVLAGGARINNDARMARQLFARHLYCLMLALVDENYLAPYDSDDPQVLHYLDPLSGINRGNGDPEADSGEAYRIAHDLFKVTFATEIAAGTINLNHTVVLPDANQETIRLIILNRARQMAQRKLTRRTIAQWAVNVVDFRDPDSIQTAFEYDENPWDGWNVADRRHQRAYPIDGDLATNENLTMSRPLSRTVTTTNPPQPTWSVPQREWYVEDGTYATPAEWVPLEVGSPITAYFRPDGELVPDEIPRSNQTRGVVWGAERPEVLLTEGVAWHDRRVEDEVVTPPDPETDEGNEGDGGELGEDDGDDDLDQFRKPKGFAYVEAYNPHLGDQQLPAELYSHVGRDSDIDLTGDPATPSPGVRLDRLSNLPADRSSAVARRVTRSPVWRIACVEEHPLIRNTTVTDPTLASALTLDDPPNNAVSQNGQQQEYLNATLYGGPWLYGTDRSLGGGASLNFQNLEFREMPEAYLAFNTRKKSEAEYALATSGELLAGIRNGVTNIDADGLLVPLGVLETPPTVPDTSFPGFDRFAQPSDPQQVSIDISSRFDANQAGRVQRGVNRKPTTFIERVFYMAAALPARISEGASTADRNIVPTPGLIVPIDPVDGAGDIPDNSPGLRVPRLIYTVKGQANDLTKANIYGAVVGFEATAADEFVIHASKFATAYDRFNLDGDNHGPDALPLQQGQQDKTETIAFAPLLPGRRAVIGTTGDIYKIGEPIDDTSPNYRDQTQVVDGVFRASFTRADAGKVADRYVAVLSSSPASDSEEQFSDVLLDVPDDAAFASQETAQLRRIEMIPDSNPNRHQFMIRMNGLNESLSVFEPVTATNPTGVFNLTSVAAAGATSLDSPGTPNNNSRAAGAPVIAIPISHFSISEPLDEYLVRQIELDPSLGKRPVYAHEDTGRMAPEEHYQEGNNPGEDKGIFDEPFDIAPELVENQTTPNYRSLHLERLANPLLPWNPPPTRPDGTPIVQHLADLPVNPYLPVDARSLDLTAFNSLTDAEKDVNDGSGSKYVNANNGTGAFGPEVRHRRKRSLTGSTGALNPARETLIGFVSNERGRPLGPFPLVWLTEPARLLWRQGGAATFSELAHTYNRNSRNGYIAESEDQVVDNTSDVALDVEVAANPTGYQQAFAYDTGETGASYDSLQFLQVPWRMTLGFGNWTYGKFFVGDALSWFNGSVSPTGIQLVDLDGDLDPGDLLGRPEVTDNPVAYNGTTILNPAQDASPQNGRPDLIDAYPRGAKPDAQGFFQQYLNTLAQDNSTTPELSWPNRPFASAGELMQVPVWGGSRMLTHFSVFNWLHTHKPHFANRTQVNPYNGEWAVRHDGLDYNPDVGPTAAVMNMIDGDFTNDGTLIDLDGLPDDSSTNFLRFRDTLGHFGHLINFFQTARFPSFVGAFVRQAPNPLGGPNITQEYVVPRGASHFYRLMDYVHVPSRFTATDTLLNAGVFSETGLPIDDARRGLSAPFNRVDSYREPGRVNLNTVVGRRDTTELARLNPADGTAVGATVPRLPDYWSEVYDGLMQRTQDGSLITNYAPASFAIAKAGHLGPAWRDVALSRRGYVQPGFDPTADPTDASLTLGSPRQNQVDYSPRRMNPDFPTLFANPFRAPGEGANVPLDHMVQTGVDATLLRAHPLSPGADGAWGRRGVDDRTVDKSGDGLSDNDGNRDDANEAGMLPIELGIGNARVPALTTGDRINADVVLTRFSEIGVARRGALPDTFMEDAFRESRIDTAVASSIDPRNVSAAQSSSNGIYNAEISKRATPVALFSGASLEPSLDTERNATLRYMPIQRMSNLTTTRSNVYAVWITVGFFEVTPAREDPRVWSRYFTDGDSTFDTNNLEDDDFQNDELEALFNRVYPGGWMLGQEIGLDTGEDRRHRGFYMVDRSRPVAFKPGEDANVSDAILIRRRIQ